MHTAHNLTGQHHITVLCCKVSDDMLRNAGGAA
jgi:hypothetical protein